MIIPAFDEAHRIGSTIEETLAYLEKAHPGSELIVVDDGSTDGTWDVISSRHVVSIRHESNLGKGAAVRSGALASRGRAVLFMDADLSTPIAEVERLIARLEDADVVIGRRPARTGIRSLASRAFNGIARSLLEIPWRDTQCGFKLFRGDVARRLFRDARIDHFAFDVEILVKARDSRLRVVEIPVEWSARRPSSVSIVFDSGRMLYDLFRIRANR